MAWQGDQDRAGSDKHCTCSSAAAMGPAPGCGQETGLGLWDGGRATSSKFPAWEPEPGPAGEPEAQAGRAGLTHLSAQRAGRRPTCARPGSGPPGAFLP